MEMKKDFASSDQTRQAVWGHHVQLTTEELFDVSYHLKYISAIFERVFGKET
jgi:hypothetical protein